MTREAVIVTGASMGIGLGIAERLVGDGHQVINLDVTAPVRDVGAHWEALDFRGAERTQAVLARICAANEVLRLCNNVGIVWPQPLEQTSIENLESSIAINLRSALLCTQAVLPAMKAAGFGRIVNLSSQAALGMELRTGYGAAKAALNTITRTWAIELACHGITVNAVAAGVVRDEAAPGPGTDPMRATIERSIALGRPGEPEEIAQGVAFFLDRRTSDATGQLLYLCGGLTIGGITGD